MRRATSLIHTSEIKILLNLLSTILVLTFVNVKTYHAYVIFRTGPRATYVVLAGDLVPAGATLVTRRGHRGGCRVCIPPPDLKRC